MENSVTLLFGRERRSPSEFEYGSQMGDQIKSNSFGCGGGGEKKDGRVFSTISGRHK